MFLNFDQMWLNYVHVYSCVCSFVLIYCVYAFDRNPNVSPDTEHENRPERSRLKNIDWAAYESVHKRYLLLGESSIPASYHNFIQPI